MRDWLALVEGHGALHRIAADVDPHEELSALTFMATRRKDSPALLFERFADNPLNARVLSNMLGASKERYALAVGLDPGLSTLELVHATRALMKQRIAPVFVPANHAPVNEVVLRGEEIDLTRLPAPTFCRPMAAASSAPAASRSRATQAAGSTSAVIASSSIRRAGSD